jgi:hypothetical protein
MNDRAQFVLLAAAVFAVALVPVVTAYHGLNYDGDVRESGPTVPDAAERSLADALGDAARAERGRAWAELNRTAAAVRNRTREAFPTLRKTALAGNASVRLDAGRARRVARLDCPRGPERAFGECVARGGVVLQNRTGRTTVVGAAVSLSWVGTERNGSLSAFVRPEAARAL